MNKAVDENSDNIHRIWLHALNV